MTPDTPERLGFDPEWDATPLAPTVEDDVSLNEDQLQVWADELMSDLALHGLLTINDYDDKVIAIREIREKLALATIHATRAPTLAEALAAMPTTAAERDVLLERSRQVVEEKWDAAHDDCHTEGELATAAGCYAWIAAQSDRIRVVFDRPPPTWPVEWDEDWWKPTTARRDLVKAGALIIAEIERLDRAALAAMEGRKDG